MLPMHDVHLACQELVRCVKEFGAVGSFVRPNLMNGHLLALQLLGSAVQRARGARRHVGIPRRHRRAYSHMNVLYGENRFYRHVASHWIEMQQALIAM